MSITINTPPILNLAPSMPVGEPSVRIRTMFDKRSGTYVTASLTVEHPAVSITPTRLTKMRLGALRRQALRLELGEKNGELSQRPPVKTFFRGSVGRTVAEKVRLEPTAAHLETTGIIYKLARLVGDYPIQSVARCFGLDAADAHRWVRLAKKSGEI